MADTLPSPPRSRSVSLSTDVDERNQQASKQLDELLEQYLEFLDTYTRLREELSKTFSAGFFSLAQAQRASTLGAGRRYGQECYDQRMKAQRIVKVEEHDSRSVRFHVQKHQPEQKSAEKTSPTIEEITEPPEKATDCNEPSPAPAQRVKQDPALRDPLTWFGILAPPSLRQTQSSFSRATEDIVPALVTINSDMKRLEERIWALRAELGLTTDYEVAAAVSTVVNETGGMEEKVSKLDLAKGSRNPGSNILKLSQSPAHSKSTLLKLGE